MAPSADDILRLAAQRLSSIPGYVLLAAAVTIFMGLGSLFYLCLWLIAPSPRPALPSEKTYITVDADSAVTSPRPLPSWQDNSVIRARRTQKKKGIPFRIEQCSIEAPELFMSVVIPAYNEEDRLIGMLEETINYLEDQYGTTSADPSKSSPVNGRPNGHTSPIPPTRGYEIILVSDGSTDTTVSTTLSFLRSHLLPLHRRRVSGPWTHRSTHGINIPAGCIRIVTLEHNRGKGGAVTHGLRHVRGRYAVFADADGASRFSDLDSLVSACQLIEDSQGRGVAVGSRAHLTSTPAVVQRSRLRNFLMHSFHLLLRLLTPPQTSRIRDTQCGFKLFSRNALPYIVPYMHCEGWIFDVEMLMLAEFAGIKVAEVPVGWREVTGSKLNVVWDSLGMAWGLALLRLCWGMGIYQRD